MIAGECSRGMPVGSNQPSAQSYESDVPRYGRAVEGSGINLALVLQAALETAQENGAVRVVRGRKGARASTEEPVCRSKAMKAPCYKRGRGVWQQRLRIA